MRTRVALFLATLISALVVVLGMGAGPATAEGESIFGFMFQLKKGERVAYEGVKVEVKGPGGFSPDFTVEIQSLLNRSDQFERLLAVSRVRCRF